MQTHHNIQPHPPIATPQAKCSLLLVDNVGAFTWQDRASRPSQPPAAAGAAFAHDGAAAAVGAPPPLGPLAAGPPLTVARVHAAAAALLQLLAVRLRLAVVAAKSAGVSWADGGTRLVQRETLPAAWQVREGRGTAGEVVGPRAAQLLLAIVAKCSLSTSGPSHSQQQQPLPSATPPSSPNTTTSASSPTGCCSRPAAPPSCTASATRTRTSPRS